MKLYQFAIAVMSIIICAGSAAEPANKVVVTAQYVVDYDDTSGLFTYKYTFSSDPSSSQEVDRIHLVVNGSVINIQSPVGWRGLSKFDGSSIIWGATDPAGIVVPPDFVDDGNLLPSIYQIKPGQSLSGFSFQSPDPPAESAFFAQGFVKLEVVDETVPNPVLPANLSLEQDSYRGATVAPKFSETIATGGRRPAIDGFLYFIGFQKQEPKVAPVEIELGFSLNGETVFADSFRATLNNVDVTQRFKPADGNKLRAVFKLGLGEFPLIEGRNVLLTTIDGLVPGSDRRATDTDRVSFTVRR